MSTPARQKSELDTPCLVLEMEALEANLQKMAAATSQAGKRLRPHAKTHKCSALALRQLALGAAGICAAKVSEAEALVRAGVRGVLVTGPAATPQKIERLVSLLALDPTLMAAVDDAATLPMLDAALQAHGRSLDVLLDLDVGLHRTGVRPADAPALAQAILARPALRLRGVQAYAGQVQHLPDFAARQSASLASLQAAAAVFRDLRASGVETCTIFSASGTGTFDIDVHIPELTELQVGSYVGMDAEYLAIGSADHPTRFTAFQPALRVLTTVVSRNQAGFVTVDAGLKALYRDGGRPLILGAEAEWVYDWFGDEYGKVSGAGPLPTLGTVLEVIPSHCDPTINLFDRYTLVRGADVVGEWPIDLRGCSQ